MKRDSMSPVKVVSGSPKRKSNPVLTTLTLLKGAATDIFDRSATRAGQEWKEKLLNAIKAMREKQGTDQTSSITDGRLGSQEMLNHPTQRSQRTPEKPIHDETEGPCICVGESFQADLPDWRGPPIVGDVADDDKNLDDPQRQGTRIWPIEGDDREINEQLIGKGRPDSCTCSFPGSVNCIKLHVSTSRRSLMSDLGQAYSELGFDRMGEDISKLWTHEDQMKFDDLIRPNPDSEGKSFWKPALDYFTSKSHLEIASYYFNVYVLRRMRKQTRLASGSADSDDDESNGDAHDDEIIGKGLKLSCIERYLKKKSKK